MARPNVDDLYVQYGCGLSAPVDWHNFDASPTLRLQKLPFIGRWAKKRVAFPDNVRFGNILSGLPSIAPGTVAGLYCSHVLEHLSLNDCRRALRNSYNLLRPGGIFRCVVPDLEQATEIYQQQRRAKVPTASIDFMQNTLLGYTSRPRGLAGLAAQLFGNAHHLWMWDRYSLERELQDAGFNSIRLCDFNDSADKHFLSVEERGRFSQAIAFECIK